MAEPSERFGQCVPSDATWSERVESASALLMLADPADLLAALRDAGLHIVSEADKRALGAVVELAREVADLHDQGEHSPQLTERLANAIAIAQLDGEDEG